MYLYPDMSKCPICKNCLLNIPFYNKFVPLVKKICNNKIDHKFRINLDDNYNLLSINLENNDIAGEWDYVNKKAYINKIGKKKDPVPFFYPDLNNCKRLFEKLNIYLHL